jgi:hypothetical protein
VVQTEGRSPEPKRGDPNVKTLRISLAAEEWRKLRAWAAEEDTTVPVIVVRVLRRELEKRPRTGF